MNKRITVLLALLFVSSAALAKKGVYFINHMKNMTYGVVEREGVEDAELTLRYVPVPDKDALAASKKNLDRFTFIPAETYGKRVVKWMEGPKLYTTPAYDNPDQIHIFDGGRFQMIEKTVLGESKPKDGQAKSSVPVAGMVKLITPYDDLGLNKGVSAKIVEARYNELIEKLTAGYDKKKKISPENQEKLEKVTRAYMTLMPQLVKPGPVKTSPARSAKPLASATKSIDFIPQENKDPKTGRTIQLTDPQLAEINKCLTRYAYKLSDADKKLTDLIKKWNLDPNLKWSKISFGKRIEPRLVSEAVFRGLTEAVVELIKRGADVNVRSSGDRTLLHLAVESAEYVDTPDTEIRKIIEKRACDISIMLVNKSPGLLYAKNKDGKTPVDMVEKQEYPIYMHKGVVNCIKGLKAAHPVTTKKP